MNTLDIATEVTPDVVTIDAGNLAALNTKISKANARAKRNGLGEPFAMRVLERRVFLDEHCIMRHTATIELTTPDVKLGDWTIVGSVILEEGGTVIRVREGVDISHYSRPDAHYCEHCHTNRSRNRSYILRSVEGELKQVGSTCLSVFTGVQIEGLWMLTAFDSQTLDELAMQRANSGYTTRQPMLVPVRWIIALSALVTDNGKSYVSRAAAERNGTGSTGDLVQELLFFQPGRDHGYNQWAIETLRSADAMLDDDAPIITEVADAVRRMSPSSDYALNMQAIVDSESVTLRSLGYATSAVTVFHREQVKRAEAAAAPRNAGYYAPVGEKITGVDVDVVNVRAVESAWGVSHLVTMRTEAGHVLKWFASNLGNDVQVGSPVTILRATVKAHEKFNGTDQTVITRSKLIVRKATA